MSSVRLNITNEEGEQENSLSYRLLPKNTVPVTPPPANSDDQLNSDDHISRFTFYIFVRFF
jgi:hypothetical protein